MSAIDADYPDKTGPRHINNSGHFLAKPSGICCLKGSIHDGEPRGSFTTIANVETYIAEPEKKNANGHILLYFPDVWGLFKNSLLMMDGFSDAGYLVLGLDYFRGDPVWKHRKNRHDNSNPDFDYEAWKIKHTEFANVAVPKWVKAVKEHYGQPGAKYACVGYCFGAPYVCDELAGDLVTAGAFGHPAFLKEYHFANMKKPLFLSCSDTDHTFDAKARQKALQIMQTKGKRYHLQLFSGVEHGFALRGDMSNLYERYVKEESLESIIKWFDFWLAQ